MNLAFDLQHDKKERENSSPQPFVLVSLWKLVISMQIRFSKVCRWLTSISTRAVQTAACTSRNLRTICLGALGRIPLGAQQ
jgi:hypothetical protein